MTLRGFKTKFGFHNFLSPKQSPFLLDGFNLYDPWESATVLIKRRIQILKFLLMAALLLSQRAFASEPVQLYYVDRPPYAISHPSGDPTGMVAGPASKIFKLAHVPVIWMKSRVNRIFSVLKENSGPDCALGYERTKSRLPFAKFTKPLYIGEPVVALASLKVKEKVGVSFAHLLAKHTILFKENYTVGDVITELIKKSPNSYITTIDSAQMVQMISHGSVDFMLISNEEITYFVRHGVLDPRTVRIFELPDVKIRFQRRIMCSKSVDDQTIEKLNAAISTLKVQPVHFDRTLLEQ